MAIVPGTAKGAHFRVTWPRAETLPRPPTSSLRIQDLEGQRLLLIEDDALVTQLLETVLGARGASVDVAVFTGVGEARNAINVLTSDVVIACGVEGPGTASEVALALRLARPTVLLAPAPEAARFFRTIAGRCPLHEVATPEAAVELIDFCRRLGVPMGLNVESVSIRREEIEASVDLAARLTTYLRASRVPAD